jgi:hypothetical protein
MDHRAANRERDSRSGNEDQDEHAPSHEPRKAARQGFEQMGRTGEFQIELIGRNSGFRSQKSEAGIRSHRRDGHCMTEFLKPCA